MKYDFQLPDFPGSNFEIEVSPWTGKTKLQKDGVPIERSRESGRPFLVPNDKGEIVTVFSKQSFPDFAPIVEINGTKHDIVEKLKWYQYVIGGLPILLLFAGGALGGAIGAVGVVLNFNTFRQEGSEMSKYLKVAGVILGTFGLYLILAFLFTMATK